VLLAWYTGHRSSAIRQLRWSDIDLEAGTIRRRAEVDKTLGGWKIQATVVAVYLRPDENAQRSALAKLAAGTR